MNKKLINVVKGDINTALENGNYNRNTTYQTNIEFNTPTKLILLDGIPYSSPLLTKVTWQELKNKRDAGELIPGSLYRITDYQCTTTQENTRSAGHQFDIVLLALSENKLAEEGWAMMHENDTYFANSNLSAWKIWYCLDNDKSRFAWADTTSKTLIIFNNIEYYYKGTNGPGYEWINNDNESVFTTNMNPNTGDNVYKEFYLQTALGTVSKIGMLYEGRGVIYRMIDEYNNDIKYDFKNIQFNRNMSETGYIQTDDSGTDTWCYTFNILEETGCQDLTLSSYSNKIHNNTFGYSFLEDSSYNIPTFTLGNNVIATHTGNVGHIILYNKIGDNFKDNSFECFEFYDNTVGNNCHGNVVKLRFNGNIIGNDFNNNTCNSFSYNIVGNTFHEESFFNAYINRHFGNNGVELATK